MDTVSLEENRIVKVGGVDDVCTTISMQLMP